MNINDLESLGLSKNEAKIYLALIERKQATASELIKQTSTHRGIVYDNLDRLIEKGLVSFVIQNSKKYFLAEEPKSLLEFLETKKEKVNKEIKMANKIIPEISKFLKVATIDDSEVKTFRGVKGVKAVLSEVLKSKENWCIGITNESTQVLDATYWKNFNAKVVAFKIKEHFLLNNDFKDIYYFKNMKNVSFRRLPKELNQMTEIILFNNRVAMFVYSSNPTVILIRDKNLFLTFRKQFDFLWKLSK